MVRWQVNAAARWLMLSLSLTSCPMSLWGPVCCYAPVSTSWTYYPDVILQIEGGSPLSLIGILAVEIKAQMDCNTAHFGYIRCTHERTIVYLLPSCQLRSGPQTLRPVPGQISPSHCEERRKLWQTCTVTSLQGGEELLACLDAPSNELCLSYSNPNKSIH